MNKQVTQLLERFIPFFLQYVIYGGYQRGNDNYSVASCEPRIRL
jgi:hypothetical protein